MSASIMVNSVDETLGKVLAIGELSVIDEPLIAQLKLEKIEVDTVKTGAFALSAIGLNRYDSIALSLVLPDCDGFSLLKRIRQVCNVPIILIASHNDEFDRIYGLELGADDFITKPFSAREFVSRIKAKIRRQGYIENADYQSILNIGNMLINKLSKIVCIGDERLELTDSEFDILALLAVHQGQTVSKVDISVKVFKRGLSEYDRSIDVHISNLRKKMLTKLGSQRIKTIRNRGYILV